ncbi:hypothetical protein RF11_09201 [Thelohanellus kitauei]|uniref:Kelch domain-containing protein 10 n=1 Tax=Thelohanellus kitauei TaxID=669202 RepID=A0A0C2N4C6_THEKT|nr:hypothetical protein RF11_09201 [Thelohanellus kitauei]
MSGGRDPSGGTRFSDIWRLDLETLDWFKLDCCHKSGTYFHYISIVDDSYLYSIGGDSRGLPWLQPFERFTLRLPSLYRQSLESVFRSPNRLSYIKSLPAAIVDELRLNDFE